MSTVSKILLYYYSFLNIILFVSMGIDKYKAIKNKMRIPEATLFIMALLGGALGGLFGMYIYKHKTKKISFHLIYGIALIIHVLLIYFLLKTF